VFLFCIECVIAKSCIHGFERYIAMTSWAKGKKFDFVCPGMSGIIDIVIKTEPMVLTEVRGRCACKDKLQCCFWSRRLFC